jgi:predicted Rossmann-fold nucleotide-binding protein
VQTRKIQRIPIVLYGSDFWNPLLDFFKTTLLKKYQTISKEDLELFQVVDSVDDAMKYITKAVDADNSLQV